MTVSRRTPDLMHQLKVGGTIRVTLKEMQNFFLREQPTVSRRLSSGTIIVYAIKYRRVCPGVYELYLQTDIDLTKRAAENEMSAK